LQNFDADVSNWDTSGVTTMRGMFSVAKAFNQPVSFNTSSVTNMEFMFYFTAFNQPLSFDTSKVTAMAAMFHWANSLSDANKLLIRCAWAGTSAFNGNARSGSGTWPVCTSG